MEIMAVRCKKQPVTNEQWNINVKGAKCPTVNNSKHVYKRTNSKSVVKLFSEKKLHTYIYLYINMGIYIIWRYTLLQVINGG